MSTDASSVEKHPGHASAAVVDDEMELARMGYKQELKCVSSLHLFQRAFSPCILPPQARPHAPPGKFCLPSFPLFSIRYTLCKNVAFSGAFMTHTHLLDAKVSLPIHPGCLFQKHHGTDVVMGFPRQNSRCGLWRCDCMLQEALHRKTKRDRRGRRSRGCTRTLLLLSPCAYSLGTPFA